VTNTVSVKIVLLSALALAGMVALFMVDASRLPVWSLSVSVPVSVLAIFYLGSRLDKWLQGNG